MVFKYDRFVATSAMVLAIGLASATSLSISQASSPMADEHPEPGLQGQTMPGEVDILPRPYSKGVKLIGHDSIHGRDSNVQLTWVDHCAYVSSTGGPFPIIGTTKADAALTGVAVIDVRDPQHPKTTRLLRDRGSIAALEALHAVSAGSRKVLAAAAYHGGPNAAGTSGSGHDPVMDAWLDIYDVSDCANPKLMAEVAWPENSHTIRISPDGKRVYGTNLSPFSGKGGIQIMDISDIAHPRFLGKFGVTRSDGTTFELASHELSFSPDGRRVYAGVNSSMGGDLNHGISISPPNAVALGPDGGGVYILDNTDFLERRPHPKLKLLGVAPGAGWHSVMPAMIGGTPYLVGGAELGICPGTWPRITKIADETAPVRVSEFRLAMNRPENCAPPTATEKASLIVPTPGTAALHFNDVDSATDTRLGLFQFLWAGLRIADLRDPAKPVEIAYFKPGDACGGHVRFLSETGHIWLSCGQSGFYVLELKPDLQQTMKSMRY
jgi:hypothetical protein